LVEADFSATLLTGTAVIALVIAYIGLYLYVASRIAELEDKINEEASKKLLTWETQYPYTATVRVFKAWCVDKEEETQYPYTTTVGLLIGATMGVLIGISVISLALGLVQADFSATLLTGTAGIALVIAYIGLYLYVKSRIAELGDKINGEASKKPRGTHLYTATVGLLIGISVVSLAFGLVQADFSATLLKGTAVIALVIAHIELYLYVESRISRSHL
jgi:cell division protein FtsW (lipid II flippase)